MSIPQVITSYNANPAPPKIMKLKAEFLGGSLQFSFIELTDNPLHWNRVDVKIFSKGTGAAFETADVIMQIPIEELSDEQIKTLSQMSLSIHPDGFFVDDNTGLVIGQQDEFEDIIKRATAVDGNAQVLKELGEYHEMLGNFGYHFADCMINQSQNDN